MSACSLLGLVLPGDLDVEERRRAFMRFDSVSGGEDDRAAAWDAASRDAEERMYRRGRTPADRAALRRVLAVLAGAGPATDSYRPIRGRSVDQGPVVLLYHCPDKVTVEVSLLLRPDGSVGVRLDWWGFLRAVHTAALLSGYVAALTDVGYTFWTSESGEMTPAADPRDWLGWGTERDGSGPPPSRVAAWELTRSWDAPGRFDPLVESVRVSHLPTRLSHHEITIAADRYRIEACDPADPRAAVTVEVRPGVPLEEALGEPAPAIVAPVGDGRACWSEDRLVWEYEPGCHAAVGVRGLPQPDRLAHRIARHVALDDDRPVRLPFTVDAPAGLAPIRATVCTGGDRCWTGELWLSDRPDGIGSPLPVPRIAAIRACPAGAPPGQVPDQPNSTVDGRPAHVEATAVTIFDIDGQLLQIRCSQGLTPDATALLRHVRLTPYSRRA